MPKVKLDAAFCLAAGCEPGKRKTDYWDTHTVGFVLEARVSGGRTYYLRYFDPGGRQRQHKIGAFGDISFDQARKVARRLRSEVVLGGDPSRAKADKKAVPTYAELADQHLTYAKPLKSYDSVETIVRLHLIPTFGELRLTEITPQVIAKWMADKADEGLMPATIEKCRTTLGRAFTLAARWSKPGAEVNPVRLVDGPKFDNRRGRFLSAEEAGRLLKVAENSFNPQLRSIIALLLLTGARVSELLNAEWDHVDLERRSWHIPVTKTKPRHVPLSQAAVEIIKRLPRFDACPWLIPNPETRKPFVSIKRGWQTVRREARLNDLRLHDLRHSCASFLAAAGVDLLAIGKVLGHADYKSSQRYAHLANETLLSAVEAGASKLNAQWAT